MKKIFILIVICFAGCKKQGDTTPNQDTLTFNANGENYAMTGKFGYYNLSGVEWGKNVFSDTGINMSFSGDKVANLTIGVFGSKKLLNTKIRISYSQSYFGFDGQPNTYNFDTMVSYIIFTRYDSIISGTFSCTGSDVSGNTINITNGKIYLFN